MGRCVVFSHRIGCWFGSFGSRREALVVAAADVLPSLPELVDRSLTQFWRGDEQLWPLGV